MAESVTSSLLVPDATRSRLLVTRPERSALPRLTHERSAPEGAVFRDVAGLLGVDLAFLRQAAMEGQPWDEAVRRLLVFDSAPAHWQPAPPMAWIPLDEIGQVELGTQSFADAAAAWTAELRSGFVPDLRPEWSRPGWLTMTEAWLTDELARHGRTVDGPVEQLGSWAISCLLAAKTDVGRVILKCVPPLFAHEPSLTAAIARAHPGRVPEVVAVDVERRRLLMAAFGGMPLGNEDAGTWADGLVAMAEVQRAWIGRRDEAAEIGVPDRTLEVLGRELDSLITDETASPDLAPADRERLVARIPEFRERIARLQSAPIPETLIHADLHPWNIQRDGDRLVIFDWSDACWSHPFFDLATFTTRTGDEVHRASMRERYLETWADHADAHTLREVLRDTGPLAELQLAGTWRRLQAIFEPDHAFPFVERGLERHLELALAAAERPIP